jgi:Flp pilus assembly protein TadD
VAAHPAQVQARLSGGRDVTIVNPKHLATAEREAVCEQCHLVGRERIVQRGRRITDFRPGLPLPAALEVFVPDTRTAMAGRAVTQVEFMRRSRCFTASGGQLGCQSCHDSHVYREPEERRSFYRSACLKCHKEKSCRMPAPQRLLQSPRDSCTQCHMPRYTVRSIPHTAATDHSIPRRPSPPQEVTENKPQVPDPKMAVVPFYHPDLDTSDPEVARCLGIALGFQLAKGKLAAQPWADRAAQLLNWATVRDPEDWEAFRAKAALLMKQGENAEALRALGTILAKAPDTEVALESAAYLAEQLQQLEAATTYWRRAIAMNPWQASYRQQLAGVLAKRGAWEETREECEASLRLEPANTACRALLIKALAMTNREEQAQAELGRLKALRATGAQNP